MEEPIKEQSMALYNAIDNEELDNIERAIARLVKEAFTTLDDFIPSLQKLLTYKKIEKIRRVVNILVKYNVHHLYSQDKDTLLILVNKLANNPDKMQEWYNGACITCGLLNTMTTQEKTQYVNALNAQGKSALSYAVGESIHNHYRRTYRPNDRSWTPEKEPIAILFAHGAQVGILPTELQKGLLEISIYHYHNAHLASQLFAILYQAHSASVLSEVGCFELLPVSILNEIGAFEFLKSAAVTGDLALLQVIIQYEYSGPTSHDINVNPKTINCDEENKTVLHHVVCIYGAHPDVNYNRYLVIVQTLVEHGAVLTDGIITELCKKVSNENTKSLFDLFYRKGLLSLINKEGALNKPLFSFVLFLDEKYSMQIIKQELFDTHKQSMKTAVYTAFDEMHYSFLVRILKLKYNVIFQFLVEDAIQNEQFSFAKYPRLTEVCFQTVLEDDNHAMIPWLKQYHAPLDTVVNLPITVRTLHVNNELVPYFEEDYIVEQSSLFFIFCAQSTVPSPQPSTESQVSSSNITALLTQLMHLGAEFQQKEYFVYDPDEEEESKVCAKKTAILQAYDYFKSYYNKDFSNKLSFIIPIPMPVCGIVTEYMMPLLEIDVLSENDYIRQTREKLSPNKAT